MKRVLTGLVIWLLGAFAVFAGMSDVRLPSIDGGELRMAEWSGRPVLVVNTASQCAFTGQYADLQRLYDRYRDNGLIVLAVPSDDFRQELDSAEAVKEFCELNYALDLPMTDILPVTGKAAHPLYREIRSQTGFEPRWNFNKVLIDGAGRVVDTWGSGTKPMSRRITGEIEKALSGS